MSPSVAGGWYSQREPRSSAHHSPCLAPCISPIGLFLDCPLWVQFSRSVRSDSLQPHGQHARLPCPSPTPRACSNSCPSSQWYHSTISSSVIPFSSHLQSFPASGSFPMSPFLASGGQKYWSFSFSISPSSKNSGLISWAAERSWRSSKEQRLHGCRRAERSYSTSKVRRGGREEMPPVQGKKQRLRFAGAAVKRHPTSKVRETQVRW